MESTVVNSKRKAEEDLKRAAEKKNKPTSTPRPMRRNYSPTMAQEERQSPAAPDQATIALIMDLKKHMSEVTQESTAKWSTLVDQVNGKVEKNTADIQDIKKSIERIERNQAVMNVPPTISSQRPSCNLQAKYAFARKSLRLWPVRGNNEHEIRSEAIRFIRSKLLIGTTSCPYNQIEGVRRTRQPRRMKGKVNNEILITFADKFARDCVAAGARNLADYKDEQGDPTAGLRMNYPNHLGSDFKALEWYGAEMRRLHGDGTRRRIRFDDEAEGLCIDVKIPAEPEWHRVHPEAAKDFKRRIQGSTAECSRAVLESGRMGMPRQIPLGRTPLSGANAVPILSTPVLSSENLLSQVTTPQIQDVGTPPLVIHNPDEITYISPKKRQP